MITAPWISIRHMFKPKSSFYIRVDGTKTRVALDRDFLALVRGALDHSKASSRVEVMRASELRDFPIPISSAKIPPPNSLGGSNCSALVSLCRYLHRVTSAQTVDDRKGMAYIGVSPFCSYVQRLNSGGTGPISLCLMKASAVSW